MRNTEENFLRYSSLKDSVFIVDIEQLLKRSENYCETLNKSACILFSSLLDVEKKTFYLDWEPELVAFRVCAL